MTSAKHGPGFHHVALRASDYDATLAFYATGLGFERAYGWGEPGNRAAMLAVGDGNYIEVFEGSGEGGEIPEGALLHYAVRAADAAASYERAIAAGATTVSEPRTLAIQGDRVVTVHIAFVKGLDGEVIEFFQNEVL